MSNRAYNIYTVIVVSILFLSISLACLFSPEKDYSESERRALAGFPSVSLQTLANGQFMNEFTDYSLDQFPLRDGFRRIKVKRVAVGYDIFYFFVREITASYFNSAIEFACRFRNFIKFFAVA